jgi:hypothetical protein
MTVSRKLIGLLAVLATIAAVAVALAPLRQSQPIAMAPPIDAPSATELQATAPVGATELLREFTWLSPIDADKYRVIVRRQSIVVWQTETRALRVAPPAAGVIERDVQYEWLVEAVDGEGNVRMTSPSQSFVVY